MKIPGGTEIYIGPPAKPMPKQVSDAIGRALGAIPEIEEAHLPMVYIKGHIDPPAQIVFVVINENGPSPREKIRELLKTALPTNSHIDILESHQRDPNLPTIRATGTQLDLNRRPH